MLESVKNFLEREVPVKTILVKEDGSTIIESGKLEVRDIPAFFAVVAASNTRIKLRRAKEAVKSWWDDGYVPSQFDPEVHLETTFGDVVFHNDTRWVVWSFNKETLNTRLARTHFSTLKDELTVITKDVVLLKTRDSLVDKDYMTGREYEELTAEKHAPKHTPT